MVGTKAIVPAALAQGREGLAQRSGVTDDLHRPWASDRG